jgi:hypothetical protein
MKIFTKVYLHFLVVGHTHNILDQAFSVVFQNLERKTIRSFSDMMKSLAEV